MPTPLRKTMKELVLEIIDVTPLPPADGHLDANGYAAHVQEALLKAKTMEVSAIRRL
jgi:hypothetical protein